MSYKLKSYEYHDQTVQVLKHEGFASGVIGMRHEQTPKTEGERTLLLARPAAWTEDTLKCHDPKKWEAFYKDGDVRSMKPKRKAVRLCQGCPALRPALSARFAMRMQERGRFVRFSAIPSIALEGWAAESICI